MFIVFLRLGAVFLMIGLGWLARRMKVIDGPTTNRLARLLVSFIYPSLIFSSMVQSFALDSLAEKWLLPLGAFGIMATGFMLAFLLLPWFGGRGSRQGRAFHFQSTINNYSFLVMPLAFFYWGEEGLAMVIFSTLGSELALWTMGIYAITTHRLSRDSLRQLLSPPMLAIFCALLVIFIRDTLNLPFFMVDNGGGSPAGGGALWSALLEGLSMFGSATIPLAMTVAGSRIADLAPRQVIHWRQMKVVMVRLILVPAAAIGWIIYLPIPAGIADILILIAVMPSAVSSVTISEIFDGDVQFAAASVLLTHLFCLATIPVWLAWILQII